MAPTTRFVSTLALFAAAASAFHTPLTSSRSSSSSLSSARAHRRVHSSSRAGAVNMFFGKKNEPLNPEDGNYGKGKAYGVGKPSVWTASAIKKGQKQSAATIKANAASQMKGRGGMTADRRAKRSTKNIKNVYGNTGTRDDWADVSNQDEAGFLDSGVAGFLFDKDVGGPQRDLESVVATQLVFATLIGGVVAGYFLL